MTSATYHSFIPYATAKSELHVTIHIQILFVVERKLVVLDSSTAFLQTRTIHRPTAAFNIVLYRLGTGLRRLAGGRFFFRGIFLL